MKRQAKGTFVLRSILLVFLFVQTSCAAARTTPTPATTTAEPASTETPAPPTIPPATDTTTVTLTAALAPKPEEAGATHIREKDRMVEVYVPAGIFLRGSTVEDQEEAQVLCEQYVDFRVWFEIESPQHEVHLDAYWIDKTEVTNEQYTAFLNEEGNQSEGGETWLDVGSGDERIYQVNDMWQTEAGYEDHPVVEVSWYGAAAYCEWAGGRLPTEAEWEKAARGENGFLYPWGDGVLNGNLANFCDRNCKKDFPDFGEDDGYAETSPVGNYPAGASSYGALDMAGNVWEWVADWFDEDYYSVSPDENPTGPLSGEYRVMRGGSWGDFSSLQRCSLRYWLAPDLPWNNVGFRCVHSE